MKGYAFLDQRLASIIIVNFNGKKLLKDCLDSVFSQNYNRFEVIFVDNASTDGSLDYVKKHFSKAKIIASPYNLGFAGGNNIGIKACQGDYIILLNADTIVQPSWLEELIKTAESNPKIGIVGSKILFFSERINSTGLEFNHKLCNGFDRGVGKIDKGQYDTDDKRDVLGVCFASALIKRKVIKDVGLLDEKTFLYSEDLGYCIRTRLRGYQVVYCPTSIVYHKLGESTGKLGSLRIKKYALRNRLRILLKNYSTWNMLKWGSYSIVFNFIISPITYFKKLEFSMCLLCFYTVFWNIYNFPWKERLEIQRKRLISDSEIFKYSVWTKW